MHVSNLCETPQVQTRWLLLFAALSFVVLIGWIDYVTGWELSLFIIYSLPIALVTWKMGWRFGFAVAFLCTVVYWLAQIESDPPSDQHGVRARSGRSPVLLFDTRCCCGNGEEPATTRPFENRDARTRTGVWRGASFRRANEIVITGGIHRNTRQQLEEYKLAQ